MKFGFWFFAKHAKNCQTLKILDPFSFVRLCEERRNQNFKLHIKGPFDVNF